LIDHYVNPSDALLSLSASLGSTGISLLGTVLLSGFVCRLAGATEHGWGALTFLRVARSLQWRQLIAADVLVVLAVVGGFLLLVVPGLGALTLLAVVGPVIEIEHRKVLPAAPVGSADPQPHLGCVAAGHRPSGCGGGTRGNSPGAGQGRRRSPSS
jgi:hypothetical protein